MKIKAKYLKQFINIIQQLVTDFATEKRYVLEDEQNSELFQQILVNTESPANFGHPSQKLLYPYLIALAAVFENKLLLEYHTQSQQAI